MSRGWIHPNRILRCADRFHLPVWEQRRIGNFKPVEELTTLFKKQLIRATLRKKQSFYEWSWHFEIKVTSWNSILRNKQVTVSRQTAGFSFTRRAKRTRQLVSKLTELISQNTFLPLILKFYTLFSKWYLYIFNVSLILCRRLTTLIQLLFSSNGWSKGLLLQKVIPYFTVTFP